MNGVSGVMVAQQKSRLLLTFSETLTAFDAGPFPPFLPELQPCVEDASLPPTFSDPSIACSQSVFWPYWIGQQSGIMGNPTNIHTRAVVLTNP